MFSIGRSGLEHSTRSQQRAVYEGITASIYAKLSTIYIYLYTHIYICNYDSNITISLHIEQGTQSLLSLLSK